MKVKFTTRAPHIRSSLLEMQTRIIHREVRQEREGSMQKRS
jgi:hypothetical protein